VSYYVIRKKHCIPGFMFVAVASWVVGLAAVTIIGLVFWAVDASMHFNILKNSPWPLMMPLYICGFYAGFSSLCLYEIMWIYLVVVDRSRWIARVGWLLALLLGMHYGAMIYAVFVWRRDLEKVDGIQPIRRCPPEGLGPTTGPGNQSSD
jgi:hypothetical protein